jgi:cytochrome b
MTRKMKYWRFLRTLTFLVVGLLNTAFIRAEDVGTWKNYIGYLLLAMAAYDFTAMIISIIRSRKETNNRGK